MTTLLGRRNVCLAITEHVPGLENSQGTGRKVPSEDRVDVPLKCGHCWRGEAVTGDRRLQRSLRVQADLWVKTPDFLRGKMSLKMLSSGNNAPRCLQCLRGGQL